MNDPIRSHRTIHVLLVFGVVGALLSPATAEAVGHGTYVLVQASSAADIDQQSASISHALAVPGVIGLSVRVPWMSLEPSLGVYDFSVLNEAKRLAGTKKLTVRFMAGRYTPTFRMGNSMVYSGSETGGMGAGSRVPLAFTPQGGHNLVFETGWKALVDQLTAWCHANGVSILHLSWPGLLWAELALIPQMMSMPGYNYNVVRDTHLLLLDYALAKTSSTFTVEFPITGHAPNQLVMDIKNHVLASSAEGHVILESNNIGPTSGGQMPPPPRRAGQVVTGSNTYNWAGVFANVRAISAEFVEIYSTSFSGGTSGQLDQQVAAFAGT